MTRTTVTCPFEGDEIPVDLTLPMTPQGPMLHLDAPELVEHMKRHNGDPILAAR